jgi:hypothetical protein
MKKIFFAIIILAFVACERSVNTPSNSIVNNWTFEFEEQFNNSGLLRKVYATPEEYMNFNTNGKLYHHIKSFSKPIDTLNYNISGDTIKLDKGVFVNGLLKIERIFTIESVQTNKLVLKDITLYNAFLNRILNYYPFYTLKR